MCQDNVRVTIKPEEMVKLEGTFTQPECEEACEGVKGGVRGCQYNKRSRICLYTNKNVYQGVPTQKFGYTLNNLYLIFICRLSSGQGYYPLRL